MSLSIDDLAREALSRGLTTRGEILAWLWAEHAELDHEAQAHVVVRAYTLAGEAAREKGAASAERSLREDVRPEHRPALLQAPPEEVELSWGVSWRDAPAPLRSALLDAVRSLLAAAPYVAAYDVVRQARKLWRWPYSDQAFYLGPWRLAKRGAGDVPEKHAGKARRAQRAAGTPVSSPGAALDPAHGAEAAAAGQTLLQGEAGRFTSRPLGDGTWEVEMRVRCSRTVAFNLQGQAFSLLFPPPPAQPE